MVIVCLSGIDQQPSITDGPGYFKTPQRTCGYHARSREGGNPVIFMAGYLMVSICEKAWFLYQNQVIDF